MRYLIIGGSAAGTFGAEQIRKNDKQGQIDILTDEEYPVYARCMTSYFLTGRYTPQSLNIRSEDFYAQNNFNLHINEPCAKIDRVKQEVLSKKGVIYPYDKLLIASGGYAVKPKMEGSDALGVHVLRTMKDAAAILPLVKKGKKAVVVGGGFVSLKSAYALLESGMEVVCVISSDYMLSRILDEKNGEYMADFLGQKGLKVIYNSDVVKIIKNKKGYVKSLVLKDDTELPADLVIIGKGVKPNIDFLEGSGIATDYGIITDKYLQTSVQNIYAAGDCANTYDMVLKEQTVNALWPNATEQGAFAGNNMTGKKCVYEGSIGMNAAVFFEKNIIGAGLIKKDEKDGYEVITSALDKDTLRRLVFKDDVLIGYYFMGKIGRTGILTNLIKRGVHLGKAKKEIIAGNYTPLLNF